MKKILKVFFLTAILLLAFTVQGYAAREVVIEAGAYETGSPAKKNASGSLGVVKGTTLGYTTNFEDQVTSISVFVACGSKAGVDIYMDSVGGTLVGSAVIETGTTVWAKRTITVPVKADISGKHKLYFKFTNTFDFLSIGFTVSEGAGNYAKFEENDMFSDIRDHEARTELNLLAELGILEAKDGDKFEPNVLATKRNFVRALSAFYNKNAFSKPDELPFKDVEIGDADYENVARLYTAGALKADKSDELKLDGAISVSEASEILCRLLGYEYKNKVGIDYYTIAQRLGILKNVSNTSAKSMKRIDMAWLLYNTLESDFDDIQAIGMDGTVVYETDINILKDTGHIYVGEGIVTASDFSNLYSDSQFTPKNTVEIDGETYLYEKTLAANYLGFNCTFFYKEVNGRKTIIAIRPRADVNYKLLSSKDTDFARFDSNKISYYNDDDDMEELKISSGTIIMYNGRPTGSKLSELVGPVEAFNGEVLLIDNDGDKKYEIVFVEQAETFIFGGVGDESIYDFITGKTIPVGDTKDAILFYGTVSCDWSTIPVGSVIDVYRCKNKAGEVILTRVYATDKAAMGVVDEIIDNSTIVFESGEEYMPYSKDIKIPEVGMTVDLKLNSFGKFVNYTNGVSEKVGLIINCGELPGGNAFEKKYGIRLLADDNTIDLLEFANNVYADGVLCKSSEEIYNGKGLFGGIQMIKENDIIRYTLNSENKIFMIDTVNKGAGGSKDTLTRLADEASYNIRGTMLTNTSLLEVCPLEKGYKVIQVDTAAGEYGHEFRSAFASSDEARKLTPYTTKEDSVLADILVWNYTKTNAIGEHFILQRKAMSINEAGDTEYVLYGVSPAGNVKYSVDANIYGKDETLKATVDSLLPGDILQTATTSKGKIALISVRYMRDGEESRASGAVVPSMSATKYMMDRKDVLGKQYWCEIVDRQGDIVKAKRINTNGDWEEFYIDCSSVKVITVDKANNYMAALNGNDTSRLMVGTKIIALSKSYAYVPYLIVMYQ